MVNLHQLGLDRLAAAQGGQLARWQCIDAGLSSRTLENWLRTGHLIAVYRGVYALTYVRNDPRSRAHAALLAIGARGVVARLSAAAVWGIEQHWPLRPQLLSAGDCRRTDIDFRRCKTLLRRDVTVIDGLRVTSAARTILDVAPLLTNKRLQRAIDGLRVRRVLSTYQLSDVIARNPNHSGAPAVKRQLGSAQQEPSRSELERAFLRIIRRYGLPVPQINVHVGGYRVDNYFPEHRLIVELDGWATHQTKTAFEHDRRQDAEILARTAIPTARFTYDQTLLRTAETADQLRTILNARVDAAPQAGSSPQ